RPVFAALLSAALITTPLLAEAYRGGGWEETFAMLAAVVVSTTVLAIGFALLRPLSLGGRERSLLSRLAVGVAGLTGAGVLWALDGMSLDARAILLLVLYPAVQMLAASLMATAVALSAANVETEEGASAERAAL